MAFSPNTKPSLPLFYNGSEKESEERVWGALSLEKFLMNAGGYKLIR